MPAGSSRADILALPDEAPAAERLGIVFEAYSAATGIALPVDPSQEQRKEVALWLQMQRDDALAVLGIARQPSEKLLVNLTTSIKAGRLAWLACPTCGPTQRSFPVDVDPWSAQSEHDLKVKIREKVTKQLQDGDASSAGASSVLQGLVCVSIIAVVPMTRGASGRKDTDNLVKGLLDAMSGVIYRDDKQVQCLTVRPLEYAGARGHYMVGIRESEPFSADIIYEAPEGATILWTPRSGTPGAAE